MVGKLKHPNPHEILNESLKKFLLETGHNCEKLDDIPSKWEKHGDLILLPSNSFHHKIWHSQGDIIWDVVADALKCKKIGRKHRVQKDNFRTPQVQILKGLDGWVIHNDNKIKYTYDVTKCMFSIGNITEKLRLAKLSCQGETIVDMYAGIGYFTLPFLIHAKAKVVHACEWNPNAVEALYKSLSINGVKEKCIIHFGDNKEVCPEKIADRVNLGLIPSSEIGWRTACKALKPCGGILHIHGTVTSGLHHGGSMMFTESNSKQEWSSWAIYVCRTITDILHDIYKSRWNVECTDIIRVKSYAPHIDHIVVDIRCEIL